MDEFYRLTVGELMALLQPLKPQRQGPPKARGGRYRIGESDPAAPNVTGGFRLDRSGLAAPA